MRRAALFLIGAIGGCFLLYAFFTVTLEPFAATQTVTVVTKSIQQEFPLSLTDNLLAIRLVAYDGPFLEDGTDEEVIGIAALELMNSSSDMMVSGEVALHCADRILRFRFTNLPAGERLLALEQNRSMFARDAVVDAQVCVREEAVSAGETVIANVRAPGSLYLENTAQRGLTGVRVFYKTFDAESEMYIGGITYSAYAGDMEAGQTRSITPYHVAQGYTRVIKVTYD